MRQRPFLLLLPLAILGVIVGAALTFDGGDTAQESQAPEAATAGRPAASRSVLAVFDRGTGRDDALPRRVTQQVTRIAGRQGIDPERSRLAFTASDGTKVFAIPGREAVCVASSQRSGQSSVGCGPHAALADGYVFDVGWNPEDLRGGKLVRARIEGLLPNGIRKVRFVLSNGAHETTAVLGNAYYAVLSAWPRRIIFDLDGGRKVTEVPQLPGRLRRIAPQ